MLPLIRPWKIWVVAGMVLAGIGRLSTLSASAPFSLVISEVHYHPGPLTAAEEAGGFDDVEAFEFLEIFNAGTARAELSGVRLTDGVEFSFTGSAVTSLEPGEYVVVVHDRRAFRERYGDAPLIAGEFTVGQLSNNGERLTMVWGVGTVLHSFEYRDTGNWPERADGHGSSLQLKDPTRDPNEADSWQASIEYGGSPGSAGRMDLHSVVINEILSHTDPPLEDAIELFNPTATSVDLEGWFLTDDIDIPGKYRFPSRYTLEPGAFAVVYEYQFNLDNPNVPFALNSVRGEEVHLLAAENGRPKLFVDGFPFPAAENGVSFGRFPDGSGRLAFLRKLTFGSEVRADYPPEWLSVFRQGTGAPNSPPRVGPLVIDRIMYHPVDSRHEFLAIKNITDQSVPLFDPMHTTNTWSIANGVDFSFPEGVMLPPGSSLIVAGDSPNGLPFDPEDVRTEYALPDDLTILGPFERQLDNAGERVELLKPDPPQTRPPDVGFVPYILVEAVEYDESSPWPEGASGTGLAIARIDPAAFGNDPANWKLTAVTASDPPRFRSVSRDPSGTLHVEYRATIGQVITLEESGDLEGWESIGEWQTITSVSTRVVVPRLPAHAFYRLRVVR